MSDYIPGWWRIADAQAADRQQRADMAQMDEPQAPREINAVPAVLFVAAVATAAIVGYHGGRIIMKAITEVNAVQIETVNANANAH